MVLLRIRPKKRKQDRKGLSRESVHAVLKRRRVLPPPPAVKILDRQHHDPSKQLNSKAIIARIVALAQAMMETKFYPYQIELVSRIVESLLDHDGEVITSLMARQMGKTQSLGAIVAAVAVIFPALAKQHPEDWRLNITDDQGVYRGYRDGVKIGIYAPRLDQADIMYQRVKKAFETDTCKQVFQELKLSFIVNNGGKVKLSNGSRILCESASEQSKIEGETHHWLILEEAQDITDLKVRKSLHPMTAATMGSIVKIGTATTQKCDFYNAIKTNERSYLAGGKRNHFFYPYTVGCKYNSLYRDYIKGEKIRLTEDSDEFRTSYKGEWIFERGMFVVPELLFHRDVAQSSGRFSLLYDTGLPPALKHYSLVAGIDWGESFDSTVVTLLAVDWANPVSSGVDLSGGIESSFTYYQKHIVSWLEFNGDNYEYQFHEIMAYLARFKNLARIVLDSNTGGLPILRRFESVYAGSNVSIVGFNFSPRLKSDGYKMLHGDLCGRRITFPADKSIWGDNRYRRFTGQMLDLKKKYERGLMVVSHPDEKEAHDDYPDSLMVANYGANMDALTGMEVSETNFFFR